MTNTVAPKGISMIQQMRKVISILLLTAVIAISFTAPSYAVDSQCVVITSSSQPQQGQKNRSSGNFSAQNCSGPRLKWRTPGDIKYNVMEDKSASSDKLILSDVTSGRVTGSKDQRNLYIANPQNATESFSVTVLNTSDPTNE